MLINFIFPSKSNTVLPLFQKMWEVIATSHSLMFISLRIDYRRLMETFFLYSYQQNCKNICICTFSINTDMQSRQNNKRFNRTSHLYYTLFIQKTDKIPKTYMFWGLKYSICHLLENCGARRAALRPYFLRSFILGSRVR